MVLKDFLIVQSVDCCLAKLDLFSLVCLMRETRHEDENNSASISHPLALRSKSNVSFIGKFKTNLSSLFWATFSQFHQKAGGYRVMFPNYQAKMQFVEIGDAQKHKVRLCRGPEVPDQTLLKGERWSVYRTGSGEHSGWVRPTVSREGESDLLLFSAPDAIIIAL